MVSLKGARRAQDRKLTNLYDSALRFLLDKSILCGRIVGRMGVFYSQYETGMRLTDPSSLATVVESQSAPEPPPPQRVHGTIPIESTQGEPRRVDNTYCQNLI